MNGNKVRLGVMMALLGSQILLADEAEEVAKKLANPVAAMISVPFQLNYNQNIGFNEEGTQWKLNIQPVIPFEVNDDWNLITRTILPVFSQKDYYPGYGTQSGVGDIGLTTWFSPRSPTSSGWIWGAGPVFLIPTDSDVSVKKWAVGPSVIVLKQEGQMTYGGLANHMWSTGGSASVVKDISTTFVQPFVSYVTHEAITYSMTSESMYDWENEQWSIPVNFNVSKIGKLGQLPVSYGGGVGYWLESPDGGPDGWSVRLVLTWVIPK